jgi:hypothetical protein
MRCMVCGAEMILIKAIPDDTMPVPGFEHHTFMCSACHDIESRLVFDRHDRDIGTEPTPGHSIPPAATTIQDDRIAVRDELFAAPVQNKRIAAPGLFRRVVAKIRGR